MILCSSGQDGPSLVLKREKKKISSEAEVDLRELMLLNCGVGEDS